MSLTWPVENGRFANSNARVVLRSNFSGMQPVLRIDVGKNEPSLFSNRNTFREKIISPCPRAIQLIAFRRIIQSGSLVETQPL